MVYGKVSPIDNSRFLNLKTELHSLRTKFLCAYVTGWNDFIYTKTLSGFMSSKRKNSSLTQTASRRFKATK